MDATHTHTHTGLEIEGIYRVSGKANDILRIKKNFDNGKSTPPWASLAWLDFCTAQIVIQVMVGYPQA